jgi:aminoglycoside 2'-N-acetyltransferase I
MLDRLGQRRRGPRGGTRLTARRSIEVAHTADLDGGTMGAVRALLDDVFGEEMTDHAWDHALGGVHALAWEAKELVGHGSVIQRRLLYRGRTLRAGYVEGVAVRADRRRRGVGGAVMAELERVIRGAYQLGALGASEDGAAFYAARGWRHWQGELWALGPAGPVRTVADDGDVYVLDVGAGVSLDVREPLTCEWREGDVW